MSRQTAGGISTKRSISDDGAQVVLNVFAERVLQRRAGFDEVKAALHDVLGLQHEVQIIMALLGYAMAPMAQLDGVDRLADQGTPEAGRRGEGSAERGAEVEGRRENAARGPAAEADGRGDELEDEHSNASSPTAVIWLSRTAWITP